MNYSRYYEQLQKMPKPVFASQLPKVRVNLTEIFRYAKAKGISVSQLSEAEKEKFIEKI